jgi:hypothetical protein
MLGMLSNPKRADVVQEQIHQAVMALVAQGHKLTKRAVANAAGCSATTVMKYRELWQEMPATAPSDPADDPLALTPENLSVWQELEAKFAPMSIATRLVGCRYDQVTPQMAAYWYFQYRRLKLLGGRYEHLKLPAKVLRPYKDRTALLEEAVFTKGSYAAFEAACEQYRAMRILQLPLPANHRFLDMPFPAAAWDMLAEAMKQSEGQVYLEGSDDCQQ